MGHCVNSMVHITLYSQETRSRLQGISRKELKNRMYYLRDNALDNILTDYGRGCMCQLNFEP